MYCGDGAAFVDHGTFMLMIFICIKGDNKVYYSHNHSYYSSPILTILLLSDYKSKMPRSQVFFFSGHRTLREVPGRRQQRHEEGRDHRHVA